MLNALDVALVTWMASSDWGTPIQDLAADFGLTPFEVVESLRRCEELKLFEPRMKIVNPRNLKAYLLSAVASSFPCSPGNTQLGIGTGCYDATTGASYVWPLDTGSDWGKSIEPLHPGVLALHVENQKFYELMKIIDSLRIDGHVNYQWADRELTMLLLGGPAIGSRHGKLPLLGS